MGNKTSASGPSWHNEKQNLDFSSQTNEQVSLMADWLCGVLPSPSLPLRVCVPSYMCVPFIFMLLGTHPKRNFKTWLQNIFVWELIPNIDNSKSKTGIITSQGFTSLTCLSKIWNSSWPPAVLPCWYNGKSLTCYVLCYFTNSCTYTVRFHIHESKPTNDRIPWSQTCKHSNTPKCNKSSVVSNLYRCDFLMETLQYDMITSFESQVQKV